MTNQEALRIAYSKRKDSAGEERDFLNTIIKALEQKPCEDAISRTEVLDLIDSKDPNYEVRHFKEDVECLPSVSTEKTGHWIMPVQDDGMSDPIYYQVRCSECGFDLDPQTWHQELHQYGADKYCPKCGCRMMERAESE